MNNPRMTVKERNLVKGAIRRVFSRSELRRKVVDQSEISYLDPNRPRVKKWSYCPICKNNIPKYLMVVDHKDPVIPLTSSLEQLSWTDVVDGMWCLETNLWAICKGCHKEKTRLETKKRRQYKKKEKSNV